MNAICIKPTSRLVKNAVYKIALYNNINSKNYAFFRSTIRVWINESTIQTFPLDNFKPEGGGVFAQTNWMNPDYRAILDERDQMKIDRNLKSGDYVVPTHDGLKTLLFGKKYKVTEVKLTDHKNQSGAVSWTDIKIKLEGSNRFYTSWNFRKCTNQETREISLKTLFDENTETEKVNKHRRKFDYLSDDEKIVVLTKYIVRSAADPHRNKMDIIDWTVDKIGKNYSIIRTDFDLIKDFSLFDALNLLK